MQPAFISTSANFTFPPSLAALEAVAIHVLDVVIISAAAFGTLQRGPTARAPSSVLHRLQAALPF